MYSAKKTSAAANYIELEWITTDTHIYISTTTLLIVITY